MNKLLFKTGFIVLFCVCVCVCVFSKTGFRVVRIMTFLEEELFYLRMIICILNALVFTVHTHMYMLILTQIIMTSSTIQMQEFKKIP